MRWLEAAGSDERGSCKDEHPCLDLSHKCVRIAMGSVAQVTELTQPLGNVANLRARFCLWLRCLIFGKHGGLAHVEN